MTKGHCAFCNAAGLSPRKPLNIEHFLPRSIFPTFAYQWENLYPCCALCLNEKGDKHDEKLLRPDAGDYNFDRYFEIDWDSGELLPNMNASNLDQQSAQITIETFQLNGYGRPQARLHELSIFEKVYYTNKELDIATFSYPFMLERSILRADTAFADIRIKSLKVKSIKCFDELVIPFNPNENSTLIIGTNSRGKTTLLQLLALGLSGLNQIPLENAWQGVVKKGAETGEFEVTLLQSGRPLTLKYKIYPDDSIECVEGAKALQEIKNRMVLGYGVNRTTPNFKARKNDRFAPIATLFGENGHIKNIQESETFDYLKNHFEAIKALTNEVFAASSLQEPVLLAKFDANSFYFESFSNIGEFIPLGALSEGFKATFVWLFDLMIRLVSAGGNIYKRKEIAGIVMIDEIDLHLHPVWQRTILPSLESVFPKFQFIVTTHSMLVGQSVAGQNLIKLKSDDKDGVQLDKNSEIKTSQMSFSEVGRELFDIKTPYNQKTELLLAQFYQQRDLVLTGQAVDLEEFTRLYQEVAAKGPKLAEFIHQELMLLELETHQRFLP